MPIPPCQPPGAQPPGMHPPEAQAPEAGPYSGPGRRRGCARVPGPPLPDPDGVRLCPVPDSAPPYDDELLPRPARPAGPYRPAETAASPAAARAGQRDRPGEAGPGRGAGSGRGEGSGRERRWRWAPAGRWAAPPAGRAAPRGRRRVAGPVRAGAGGNAGRIPAATADIFLGHRTRPGPDPAPGPDARRWPPAPAAPGGGVPARVRRDRDDRGGQLRAARPRPGHPPGAQSPTPGPARTPARPGPVAVHRGGGRLAPARLPWGRPVKGRPSGPPPKHRRGCGDRRGSACTSGPSRTGTGRCGRPG